MGRAGLPVGQALRRPLRRRRSRNAGTGRPGTKPNIGYWRGHARGVSSSCTTTPSTPCAAPCPRPASAARTRPAAAAIGRGRFSSTACAATNYATGENGTPLDFVSFHAKGAPRRRSTATSAWASPSNLRTIDDGFRIVASFPELERHADRHRRVRPRGLRRLPGPAARLSQRHDVLQLHRRQLRAQPRSGRPARREHRRRPHLGVRVRRPSAVRRLSLAGHRRHRQARAERLSHVQQDERRAAGSRRATTPCRSTGHDAPRRPRARPTSRRWPASTAHNGSASSSGITTTTTCPATTPM